MSMPARGRAPSAHTPTIFLAAEQGFSSRYLFRTGILPTLLQGGARLVVLSPHAREPYFVEEFASQGVAVEPYHVEQGLAYMQQSRLHRRLRLLRDLTAKSSADLGTFEARRRRYASHARGLGRLTGRIAALPVPLLRRSRLLRRALVGVETALFTPGLHADLFRKYRPDLLVVTSLGNMRGIDAFLMREARRYGTSVASIVLSWDNTSTRGIGGAGADYIVAWTPTMKRELVDYYDVREDQIFVGGVAHWDSYYTDDGLTREQIFARYGLDPARRLILFATASPTGWAELNVEVVEILGQAIGGDQLAQPCQVLVRPHPIYLSQRRESVAREALPQLRDAAGRYPHIHVAPPKVKSRAVTFDLSSEDADELKALLRHCDVLVTSYSTVMLEGCIFDKPVINVAFERFNARMGQAYTAVANYPHLKRVLLAGGMRTAATAEALIDHLNDYLLQPDLDSEGRARIVRDECGPHPGTAGQRIGEHLLHLLQKDGRQ